MRNLKLAVRTLRRTPFVTAVAVLSLALGIGANAAIFSLLDQMLLAPLPVAAPERLINLSAPGPKPGSQSCNNAGDCDVVFSFPMFRDLAQSPAVRAVVDVAAHRAFGANLAFRNATLNADGMMVSGSYFSTLGLRPALGRLIGPSDDQTVGAHFVAVLGHGYWQTNLGADPAVIGQTIIVNGQAMTVIGVAPEGFDGTTLGTRPRVYVPITMRGYMNPGFQGFENRRSYWAYLFARLKPGVTPEQAERALNQAYRPILADVEAPLQQGMSDSTLARFKAKTIAVEDGRRGQSSVHEEASTPLFLLFAITGIVLLIACANIANLLLARGAGRAQEMAVRLSIGAGRRHVIAQLLTESLVLAAIGGLASLLVARWTLATIGSFLPSDAASTLRFEVDGTVAAFVGVVALVTGVVFGMFPALHSTRPDLISTMRASSGQPSGARAAARFRTSLVTAQIALSMALLISAGLFIKSLANVSRVDLGLDPQNVVTFGISPELSGYDSLRARQLFERAEDELATLPGVSGVTASLVPILSGSNWGNDVRVQGYQSGPDIDSNARFNSVSPNYFRTLGMNVLAGREFTRGDALGAQKVAIVNEAFAKKFGLGADAVGKFMSQGGDSLDIQIVGLARDAKYSEVKDEVPPLFFIPWRQMESVGYLTFYVRTAQAPEQALGGIRQVMARLDPNLPLEELKTLPQQVKENVFLDRMISTLAAAFAVLATLLAAVGLYGVLAYTVAQRTREIGVRMALGADAGRVRGMVIGQVTRMVIVGGVLGLAAAFALGRAASSLLFGLEGHDPAVMIGAAVVLALVALGAGYVPALRASRVDPMQALRYE